MILTLVYGKFLRNAYYDDYLRNKGVGFSSNFLLMLTALGAINGSTMYDFHNLPLLELLGFTNLISF